MGTRGKKNSSSSQRPRSSSIDGKKRSSKNDSRLNAKTNGRKHRNNSMDSVVSLSPAPTIRKIKSVIAPKSKPIPMVNPSNPIPIVAAPQPKAAAPLTPGSAMEALKNAAAATTNVLKKCTNAQTNESVKTMNGNVNQNTNNKPALAKT